MIDLVFQVPLAVLIGYTLWWLLTDDDRKVKR